MSALNKLIFINSLDAAYQEFDFVGNIHFSGSNGQGKTILLRAILFAYSGDVSSLGNYGKETLFAESNSAIIFQFGEGKKAFTVCAIKPENEVELILVKGLYEKEIFLTNKKLHTRANILKAIKKRKLDFLEKVYSGSVYREVIYGHSNGKNSTLHRKFTLTKLPHPDLISLTQHQLFSDAPFEIEILKDQLGNLFIEEKQQIDLSKIRESLTGFVGHLNEIESFYENQSLLPEIRKSKSLIQDRKSRMGEVIGQLKQRFEAEKKAKKELGKAISQTEKKLLNQKEIQANLQEKYQTDLEAYFYQKSELKFKINRAKEKAGKHDLIALKTSASSLPILRSKRQELETLLAGKPASKKTKKDSHEGWLNQQIAIQELETQRVTDREKILLASIQAQEDLATIHQEEISQVEERINKTEAKISELKNQEYEVRKNLLSSIGGKNNPARITHLEEEYYRLCIEEERSQQRLKDFQLRREVESEELERKENEARIENKKRLSELEKQIEEVKSQITNMRGSFQGWLENNYPDWKNSIGKILRPDVLMNPYLSPEIERINELFYGIKLDLDEVESEILTVHDLQNHLADLEKKLEDFAQNSVQEDAQWEKKKTNLDKRFRQKIRQEENEIKKFNYEIEQVKIRLRQQKEEQGNRLQKLIQETEQKAIGFGYEIVALEKEVAALKENKKQLIEKYKSEKANLKSDYQNQIELREKKAKKDLEKLTSGFDKNGKTLDEIIGSINEKSSQQDIQIAIFDLDEAIQKSENDLALIRQLKSKQTEAGNLPFWKTELKTIESKIKLLQKQNLETQADEQNVLVDLQNAINDKKERLDSLEKELSITKEFLKKDWISSFESKSEELASEPLLDLIEKVKEIYHLLQSDELELSRTLQRFSMTLSQGNIFGFPVDLKTNSEALSFAEKLIEFDEKGGVEKVESDLAARYAGLIDEIANSVRQIENLETKLKDGVGEWDQLIQSFDFQSELKKIDLKLKDVSHPLPFILKRINDFSKAHANQLGEGNLFNQTGNQKKNGEALELLKQLHLHLQNQTESILPASWLFDIELKAETPHGEFKIGQNSEHRLSRGNQRLLNCILRMSFLKLIISNSDASNNLIIQCLLDNISELDSAQLSTLTNWLKTLDIELISASVEPPSLMDIDQGYRLTRTSKATVRAYQIFSRAG